MKTRRRRGSALAVILLGAVGFPAAFSVHPVLAAAVILGVVCCV